MASLKDDKLVPENDVNDDAEEDDDDVEEIEFKLFIAF